MTASSGAGLAVIAVLTVLAAILVAPPRAGAHQTTSSPGAADAFPIDAAPSPDAAVPASASAAADPDEEIAARYAALGGASSFLGPPTGPVTAVPGGYARVYRSGRIYWSQDHGARFVFGAILGRYLALGGSGGVLGMPTSDEERVPDGRRSTFTGGHVYWSQATGAHSVRGAMLDGYLASGGPTGRPGYPLTEADDVGAGRTQRFQGGRMVSSPHGTRLVYGAIGTLYERVGGTAGVLGVPTSDEYGVTGGRARDFTGGRVYWTAAHGAHAFRGAILDRYDGLGGTGSLLGPPVTGQYAVPGGRAATFLGGRIYWSPSTGAHWVYGAILHHYLRLGGPGGVLGLPTTGERIVPGGRASEFTGGRVYWSAAHGAHAFRGAILDRYDDLGATGSFLGPPASGQYGVPGGRAADFARGRIYWSPATGAHEVWGHILGRYLLEGGPASPLGLPTSGEHGVPVGRRSDFQGGSITWNARTGAVTVECDSCWRPQIDAARAYGEARAGSVSFAAIGTDGRLVGHRSATRVPMASVLKVMFLTAYLRQPSVRDRPLTAGDRSLLEPMIRVSANDPATRIADLLGPGPLSALAREAGMQDFSYTRPWGLSTTSARDQVRFLRDLDRLLPPRHRAYALDLLTLVTPSQRWGIGEVATPGWTQHFKGGWGSGTGATDHQVVRLVHRDGTVVTLAVMTTNSPDHEYGKDTLAGVFARLLANLP